MEELPQDGAILSQSAVRENPKGAGYLCTLRGGPEDLTDMVIASPSRAMAAIRWCDIVRGYIERKNREEAAGAKRPDSTAREGRPKKSLQARQESVEQPPTLYEAANARADFVSHQLEIAKSKRAKCISQLMSLGSQIRGYEAERYMLEELIKEQSDVGESAGYPDAGEDSDSV